MSSTVERILELVKKNNSNAKQVLTEAGIPPSAITEWKKGRAKPSTDSILKLSRYFNVSTDYLLLGTHKNTTLTPEETKLLDLYNKLPPTAKANCITLLTSYSQISDVGQKECLGFVRGYAAAYKYNLSIIEATSKS